MKGGSYRKVGWVWTKTGWKRVPKRSQAVKKIPVPTKRRARRAGEGGFSGKWKLIPFANQPNERSDANPS